VGKKLIGAGIGLAGMGIIISGCNQGIVPGTTSGTDVQQLQADTVAICGWLPVAETIVGLVPTVPADVSKVAETICAAVKKTAAPAVRGVVMAVTVNGQTIRGSFVSRPR
jgi:hypothetical protein